MEISDMLWMKIQNHTGTARKKAMQAGVCLTAVFFLAAAQCGAGYGATDSSVIESLSIAFKTTYGEPEEIPDPEISLKGTGCSLGDIQFRTDYDKWKPGRKVRVEITVNADEGKVFPVSLSRSKCKVSGANFVSAKALDDDSLQVKVDYMPATVLGVTSKAGWSASKKRAVWKEVDYAPGYSVVLYGNDKVVKRLTVEGTNSVNLAEYMEDVDKTYYYEVKAIPVTSDQKKYLKEGDFVTSTDQELDWEDLANSSSTSSSPGGRGTSGGPGTGGPGNGAGDGGAIKGNNYILPDGKKETNTWKKISNQWYYFNQNGDMARGWQNVNGFWYYMDVNGIMQNGWVNPSGDSWFYLNENGDMATGWIHPHPSEWYYLDGSGYMQRGWVLVNNKWYYMNESGRMQTGWTQVGDKWYYLNNDGSMEANTTVNGRTLGPDGAEIR